jgi:hypothetical protein
MDENPSLLNSDSYFQNGQKKEKTLNGGLRAVIRVHLLFFYPA